MKAQGGCTEARVVAAEEILAGVSFPDPYRWLEHENDEVRQWQRAQAKHASSYVQAWPHYERLRQLVAHFSTERPERTGAMPYCASGRWFRTQMVGATYRAQAIVSEQPLGPGRVLFDTAADTSQRSQFLSWIAPSPDGRTLALGVCTDGSENNNVRLIEVETGRVLSDPPAQVLMDNWTGGVQWLPDSSGFFFSALDGAAIEFEQRVYLHRRLPVPATVELEIPWTEAKEYRAVVVSRDGCHAVAVERLTNPIPVAVAHLRESTPSWRPFITTIDGTVAGHAIGNLYIAVTNVGAPRGRLVAIDLDEDDPNDPDNWQELRGESAAVLRTVTPVDQFLYLSEFIETYARVRIVDLAGRSVGEVPLPGPGAMSELSFPLLNVMPRGDPPKFIFGFSSLIASPGIYSHTPGDKHVETLLAPKVVLEDCVVEDHWAVSPDGTRIPYHLVHRLDVSPSVPQPTLIYAYGGYNAPLVPHFPGPMAAFVAAGGVFVHAHLRGGGEFGRDWWEGGRQRNKQNCYDDLYAVAEDLIAANRCTPATLAVTGRSNGGLMAAVAAMQRPELWKAVVPRVPILDLIGACRDPYDRMCVAMEYADVENPEDVRRLARFSPYHLVRDDVQYPALFLDAGNTDPRCPPWHARKFAARMQKACGGEPPVLLHVWENVGHGWATDKSVAEVEHTEWLAFIGRQLGMQPVEYPLR